MTEQERIALSGIKGMLTAHVGIHTITVKIAEESQAKTPTDFLRGFNKGQIAVASKAIEQNQRLLDEVNKLLEGGSSD